MAYNFDSAFDNTKEQSTTYTSIVPHEIPKVIWKYMEPRFKKYNVEMRESMSMADNTKTVLVWNIEDRRAGDDQGRTSGGARFSGFLNTHDDTHIISEYTQIHTMVLDFTCIGQSTSLVHDVLWELETSIEEIESVLRTEDQRFTVKFIRTFDGNGVSVTKREDDLVSKTLRLNITLPIRTARISQKILNIKTTFNGIGSRLEERVTRTSSDTYYPTKFSSESIIRIFSMAKWVSSDDNDPISLEENVDYTVKSSEDGSLYIEWNSEFGSPPSIGQEFSIIYYKSKTLGKAITTY